MRNFLLLSSFLFVLEGALSIDLSVLSPPYNTVNLLPFNPHNWFGQSNQRSLEYLIKTRDIKVIFEIGSWMGGSTRYMASQLPADGVVYAIDHFKGSVESNKGGDYYMGEDILDNLYD